MAALESDRLDHVTTNWDEATSTLLAHALPILRVTESFPGGNVTVIWRNEPTPEQQMQANRLIRGVVPIHAW
jgi:hypothetical protein